MFILMLGKGEGLRSRVGSGEERGCVWRDCPEKSTLWRYGYSLQLGSNINCRVALLLQ
jgi:hypothetical protein